MKRFVTPHFLGDIIMHLNKRFIPTICLVFLIGCATQHKTDTAKTSDNTKPTPDATKPTPTGRIVKSKDGSVEGEIVGTPAPKSKFAKLQIGMTPEEAEKLIGRPDGSESHATGKGFIPFHFSGDTQRLELFYKHEGQLTFSNTNNFTTPNALIKIEANPKATGISK
jgi:hypothetical protein